MTDAMLIEMGHGRARVWRDSLPYEPAHAPERASRSVPVPEPAQVGSRLVAIEAMRPMGFPAYGMIGGRFEPENSDSLVVSICCPDETTIFQSAVLRWTNGSIRRGLPEEYHGAVLDQVDRFCRDGMASPGVLRVACAAHCAVGSSRLAFSGLTKALLGILYAPDADSLAAIVGEPWSMS